MGHILSIALGKNKRDKNKKKKGNQRDKFILKKSVELAGETYTDVALIKARCRKILSMTKDGEKVQGNDSDFVRDLLKYHKKADEILKDLNYLTTGQPSLSTYSRCFYVVRNDDSKEDFSAFKCIEWLQIKQNKKQ